MEHIRPLSMRGTLFREPRPIPTRVTVGSASRDNPAVRASSVSISFAPTDREVVDRAVAAFRTVLAEAQT